MNRRNPESSENIVYPEKKILTILVEMSKLPDQAHKAIENNFPSEIKTKFKRLIENIEDNISITIKEYENLNHDVEQINKATEKPKDIIPQMQTEVLNSMMPKFINELGLPNSSNETNRKEDQSIDVDNSALKSEVYIKEKQTYDRHLENIGYKHQVTGHYTSRAQVNSREIMELCDKYNSALKNLEYKDKFMKIYRPIRFGVINAMKRLQDPKLPPVFQNTSDGNYYAIPLNGNKEYYVVPRFDIVFQENDYGPGAMGYVFDCQNYNHRLSHSNINVEKPAIFEYNSSRNQWSIMYKGRLNLKQN